MDNVHFSWDHKRCLSSSSRWFPSPSVSTSTSNECARLNEQWEMSPKAALAHVNTRWCFTLCLGTISGSYKTSYKYFFFSLVTLRTEPHVSELICEIKGRKSVSVSGGDHACSLIFLPNRPGSLPGTVRYARSVTSSLWMIHGYKLPPKGMGRGGKALYFRAINLCAFNVVFSHMSKWW